MTFTIDDVFRIGYDPSEGVPTREELEGADIVYVTYESGDFDGGWCVIFVKEGQWFIDMGSHCSCFGPGWSPKATDPKHLLSAKFGPYVSDKDRITACVQSRLN